jgi:hypothetical protein
MKKQFIALTGLLVALIMIAACNGGKKDVTAIESPDINSSASSEPSAAPITPTTSEKPTTTEYPSWDEIAGGTTPYIPPLTGPNAEGADDETSPTPIVEPGEVKPVPTKPPEAEVAASMPPVTPTPTQKPTTPATPAPASAPTATPESVPVPTPAQEREPYVDAEGKYHLPVQTIYDNQAEIIYYQDEEGGWCEGMYEPNGEWYQMAYYRPGTLPLSSPGAPWNEEKNNRLEESAMINKELDRLLKQGYSYKDAYEKLYEAGLVTRTIWEKYTIEYYGIKTGTEIGRVAEYDMYGLPYRDKDGNPIAGYLDGTGHIVESFYREGGNPYYDESGNYVGQLIQYGEEGMHWERDSNGKMVGTYKGVVIPVPYVAPIPPLG